MKFKAAFKNLDKVSTGWCIGLLIVLTVAVTAT